MVTWQNNVKQKWEALLFVDVKIETNPEHHTFEVQIYLEDLNRNDVKVELFADDLN